MTIFLLFVILSEKLINFNVILFENTELRDLGVNGTFRQRI